MFTATLHHTLVMWAGPEYLWTNGPIGKTGRPLLGTRPRTDTRNGLRAYLFDYASGRCVFCDTAPAEELAHIVAAGPQIGPDGTRIRRGYVPGNIAPACHACNEEHAHEYGAVVPMAAIARPDLIATVWPSETALRTMAAKPAHVA